MPVVASQQPPLHTWFELHEVVHFPRPTSHAWPVGQSPALAQPQTFVGRQTLPLGLPLQLWHSEPTAPHALSSVPGLQKPPLAAAQQPFWQGIVDEQEETHRMPVQALAVGGQSVNEVQPHWPPPLTATQKWPFWLLVQSEQRPPFAPQVEPPVPDRQLPFVAAEQQPPLQGVLLSQAMPHVCVIALHAKLGGQSLGPVQPQLDDQPIDTHALPALFPKQVPQIGLPSAHCALEVPVTHCWLVLSQQPPLHGELALQGRPHEPAWQACPTGQSVGLVQPPPASSLPPPSLPPPLSSLAPPSLPLPATIATASASQPAASVFGLLAAAPSTLPPASADSCTPKARPAG
jgi:hypothetical protein